MERQPASSVAAQPVGRRLRPLGLLGPLGPLGLLGAGLRAKLTLLIALTVVLTAVALAALSYRASRATLQDQLAIRGRQLARDLALSARLGLLSGDRRALSDLTTSAIGEPDVRYAAFLSPEGEMRASAGRVPAQAGGLLDLSPGSRPRLALRDLGRGRRVYDVAAPVAIERAVVQSPTEDALFQLDPTASTTPGPAAKELVGFVRIGLSFDETDRRVREALIQGTIMACLVALLGLVVAAAVARVVTRRLAAVMAVSRRLAEGHLGERVPEAETGDELNDLAIHFNRMADALAQRDEILRANEELRAQNISIQKASAMKSAFLATMSHELRTPLHAILGFTRLVLRKSSESLPDKQRDNLRKVEISAVGLLELINGVLDLSKIEAGHMEIHTEVVDLGALAMSVVEGLAPLAQARSLSLRTIVAPQLPPTASDPVRVRQVLTNLVSNAIKFTTAGEVVVEVRWQADAHQYELSVRDTGAGIPENQREHIFEPFHQVDGGATRSFGGTGLGLAIVRDLLGLLGGTIRLESEVGKGSTFSVHLPRRDPVGAMPLTPDASPIDDPGKSPTGETSMEPPHVSS